MTSKFDVSWVLFLFFCRKKISNNAQILQLSPHVKKNSFFYNASTIFQKLAHKTKHFLTKLKLHDSNISSRSIDDTHHPTPKSSDTNHASTNLSTYFQQNETSIIYRAFVKLLKHFPILSKQLSLPRQNRSQNIKKNSVSATIMASRPKLMQLTSYKNI